jgi:hypothetical protein
MNVESRIDARRDTSHDHKIVQSQSVENLRQAVADFAVEARN